MNTRRETNTIGIALTDKMARQFAALPFVSKPFNRINGQLTWQRLRWWRGREARHHPRSVKAAA